MAWVPDGLTAVLLAALAISLVLFLRILLRVRDRVGIGETALLAFAFGFAVLEAYLLLRVWRQGKKAIQLWRNSRK